MPTEYNIHKVLLVSVMLANKYAEDSIYNLKYYARVGGISEFTLANAEAELLERIDYNLFVSDVVMNFYKKSIKEILNQCADS